MKKAVYHEVKSSSFAVEPGKAGRADWEQKGQCFAHAGLVGGRVCGSGCGEPARLGASAPTSFLLPALPARPGEGRAAPQFCVHFVFLSHLPSCQAWLGFMVWRGRETTTPELHSGVYKQRCGDKQGAWLLLCVGQRGTTRRTSPGEGA